MVNAPIATPGQVRINGRHRMAGDHGSEAAEVGVHDGDPGHVEAVEQAEQALVITPPQQAVTEVART